MTFLSRLKLKKLERQITERKEYILEFYQSYYYVLFLWRPDWEWGELANDKSLNQLYYEADNIIKNDPVDKDIEIPKSMLTSAN